MNARSNNLRKAAKVLILGKNAAQPETGKKQNTSSLKSTLEDLTPDKQTLKNLRPDKNKHPILKKFSDAASGLAKESKLGPQLHDESLAALERMQEMNSDIKKEVSKAYGFAVFPSASRAALLLGVTYGKGAVFEQRKMIGYAGIIQITFGVQLGGETVHILVLLKDKDALKRLKSGKVSFAANASLGIVKTGVKAAKAPYGLRIFVFPEGGEMLEAAIGGQSIKFRPAALGRLKSSESETREKTQGGNKRSPPTQTPSRKSPNNVRHVNFRRHSR